MDYIKTETIEDAIKRLKAGDGWCHPLTPKSLGLALENLKEKYMWFNNQRIETTFETWNSGNGCDFVYHHDYTFKFKNIIPESIISMLSENAHNYAGISLDISKNSIIYYDAQ